MAEDSRLSDEMENQSAVRASRPDPARAVWQFFSSMRTAIVLLLILAAVSVVGTVIMQNAPSSAYISEYGNRTYSILNRLGLTHMYESSWYLFLLLLIGLNLAVCSINRFGIAWRQTFRPSIPRDSEDIFRMQRHEKLSTRGNAAKAASSLTSTLRSRSYRVWKERDGNTVSIFAVRGRIGVWGPYLTHLSILLIFAGAVLGGRFGFQGYTVLTEGGSADKYEINERMNDLGFSVRMDKFTVKHDDNHDVTGFKSALKVYDGGRLAASKTIDVNHPLTYRGVSFYQTDCGIAGLRLKVEGTDGKGRQIAFQLGDEEMLVNRVDINGKTLYVLVPGIAPDYVEGEQVSEAGFPINPGVHVVLNDQFPNMKTWQDLGWLTESQSAKYKAYTVTLEKVVKYSGLKVSSNPGLPIVYTGFGLMLLGIVGSFYVTRKVIRLRIAPSKGGVSILAGATSRGDASAFDRDFERLKNSV